MRSTPSTLPSYAERALDVLKQSPTPMTWQEITAKVSGSCGETISRALRRMRKRGLVVSQPVTAYGSKGPKVWTASAVVNPAPTTSLRNFKGSSGKVTVMCLPTNKPTLVTATIQAVEFLRSQKTTFSAHDVTKKLREMVKDGLAHVDDAESGTIFAYGRKVPKIEHDDVRDIVHEYFKAGKLPDYAREMQGDHWKYVPDAVQATSTPTSSSPDYSGDPTL